MPRSTRAEDRATFLHILHKIFDMDVGSPLALALDNCGIVTVADLSTMTPEMIALLDYPNALLSDNIDKRTGPTQELELMPLKLGYKSILEWFPTWAYALYLANECMPLSAVAWYSMTAADFDFYRTSLGTITKRTGMSSRDAPIIYK